MENFKSFLLRLGLYKAAISLRMRIRGRAHRLFCGEFTRGKTIAKAITTGKLMVQLGCGERMLPGWINADIYNGDIYLDITKTLPFPDNSVDLVYSHHLIEHVELKEAVSFFKELARICKTGARIRFVTPSLNRLIDAYSHPQENKDLIAHYCKSTQFQHPVEMFNQELRQNGEHRYIYSLDFIKLLLEQAGFCSVIEEAYNISKTAALNGLDDHGYAMIGRISMAVEATKT